MFPSPPNSNCDTPNLESLLKRSSSQNPTSITPSLLFNFSSPFLDEHESPLNQIFSQNHDHTKPINLGKSKMEQQTLAPPEIIPTPRLRRSLGAIPRRRAGKKDRHSKICTAQGIRDRRMRLSLQVARKFFDLQDMLGYDKASKTIEWLFNQSKKAINELVDDLHHQSPPPTENNNNGEAKSESFVSECEEMSGIEETNSSNVVPTADADPLITSYRSNARESRDRARARARCRTREKMLVKLLHFSGDCFQPNPIDFGKINSPFLNQDQDQDQDQNPNPNTEGIRVSPFEGASSSYNSIQQQLSDVGTIERFLGNSSSSTSCPISDYADPNSSSSGSFMEFLGSWDVLSSERTNCFHYSVTNQFSFAGNLTAEFP